MKTKHIIIVALGIISCVNNARAESCGAQYSCSGLTITGTAGTTSGCSTYSEECYAGNAVGTNRYKLISCTSCPKGYYPKSTTSSSVCSNRSYNTCTKCPIWSGVYTDAARQTVATATSKANNDSVTGCYVVSGTYYDATGKFELKANCYY